MRGGKVWWWLCGLVHLSSVLSIIGLLWDSVRNRWYQYQRDVTGVAGLVNLRVRAPRFHYLYLDCNFIQGLYISCSKQNWSDRDDVWRHQICVSIDLRGSLSAVVRFAYSSIMQSLTVRAAWCCVIQPLSYLYGLDRPFLFCSEIQNCLPSTPHN